jgi:uncharacterized protein YxeA
MKNLLIILISLIVTSCSSYKNAYKMSTYEKNANNYLVLQAQEMVKKNERKKDARSRQAHKKQIKLEKYLHEINDASTNRINPHHRRAKRPSPFY